MWIPSMEINDDGAGDVRAGGTLESSLAALSSVIDRKIVAFFLWLGSLCGRKPRGVLAVSTCLVVVCGCGLAFFNINSDDDSLYLPADAISVERNGVQAPEPPARPPGAAGALRRARAVDDGDERRRRHVVGVLEPERLWESDPHGAPVVLELLAGRL